jgi:hypothetical protein
MDSQYNALTRRRQKCDVYSLLGRGSRIMFLYSVPLPTVDDEMSLNGLDLQVIEV